MNRSDINELHFITHIGNVPSIMRSGIVSRNKAERDGIDNHDISEGSVQDR